MVGCHDRNRCRGKVPGFGREAGPGAGLLSGTHHVSEADQRGSLQVMSPMLLLLLLLLQIVSQPG